MTSLFLFAPAPGHTREHHPENQGRLRALLPYLDQHRILSKMMQIMAPQPATVRQVLRVHDLGLIEQIRRTSGAGGGNIDADTYVTAASYDAALLAAGTCCQGVDLVLEGRAHNGICVVRPPGHHARENRAGGFCLFNNVAVAVRQAQQSHGLRRIAIVDYDVHHGNGTQDLFYADENVLFVSLHLHHPFFYPGTGGLGEIGQGAGRSTTINVPFPAHVGDEGYSHAVSEVVAPAVRRFQPEMLLISAGFDAHWRDPLASASLSLSGYARITRILVDLAKEMCDGRILFVLEGGYYIDALHAGLLNTCRALVGIEDVEDPLGPYRGDESDVTSLLAKLKSVHLLE